MPVWMALVLAAPYVRVEVSVHCRESPMRRKEQFDHGLHGVEPISAPMFLH
jgi:hypothetical protein